MDIQEILGIIGGLGLLVFAIHILSDSLQKLAHTLLKSMLETLTSERFRSLLVGIGAASITQSSTAMSITVTGFLNSGIIQLSAALAVMIGANVGTTVTAQIMASNLGGVAPFFIIAGALLHFLAPKSIDQNRGLAIFGLGVLFLGISMMSSSIRVLAHEELFGNTFMTMTSSPLAGILTGLIITVILRNSSTAAGLIIAFALGGMLDLRSSLYLVFGINMGACVNVVIAAVGSSPASKQLALGNVICNFLGLIAALAMVPLYLKWLPLVSVNLARQIALGHTFFNIAVMAISLPLVPYLVSILEGIFPAEEDKKQEIRYLSENFLSMPYLAIMAVIRELTVMLSICQDMLDKAEACVVAYNHKIKNELIFEEESVDEMQKNITAYLVEITRNELTARQQRLIPALLHSVNDLEKVADYCENIVILAQRVFEEKLSFSGGAREELERLFRKTRTMMKLTMQAINGNDHEAARITLNLKKEIDELIDQYKLNHVNRLESGACESEPGLVFSDILTDIDRMNSHLLNITKGILHIGKR